MMEGHKAENCLLEHGGHGSISSRKQY